MRKERHLASSLHCLLPASDACTVNAWPAPSQASSLAQHPDGALTCFCVIPAELYCPEAERIQLSVGNAGLQAVVPHASTSSR